MSIQEKMIFAAIVEERLEQEKEQRNKLKGSKHAVSRRSIRR